MRKRVSIFLLVLLASSLTLSIFPTAKAQHAPITIDGDPSDWTGTPGGPNTWVYNDTAKEWIWTDEVGDDTGNGTYTYPTGTAFTGAEADLTELRIAWNTTHVMFLLRFDDIGDNGWVGTLAPYLTDIQAETTAVAILIDTDHVPESGYWEVEDATGDTQAEINLTSTGWWEYYFEIALDDVVLWRWDAGLGTVELATREIPTAVNVTLYEAIEAAVPIDPNGVSGLPNPEGTDWSFFCFIGLQDYHHFREVDAVATEWQGGGGSDSVVDPDAYDCAFFGTKAEQEAALNGFDEAAGTYAVIPALGTRQIPEFPLPYGFVIITATILLALFVVKRRHL